MSESDPNTQPETAAESPPDELLDGAPPIPLEDVIEAVLFSSHKPVTAKELGSLLRGAAESGTPETVAFKKMKEAGIRAAVESLAGRCQTNASTYEVRETAAGWQLVTKADFAPWLRQLFPENRPARLSAPAMETLAIIAYRQPITRADIEAVRGVAVDGVMQTLLDRGLVKIAGRAEVPGRPLLYETTQFFMEHFGIKNLDELPNAGELRRIQLPAATAPPAEPAAPDADAQQPPAEETPQDQSPEAENAEEPAGAEEAPAQPDDQPS